MINRTFLFLTMITMLIFSSCTDQRDLYVREGKHIKVKADWTPSNMPTDNGATIFFYNGSNIKEMLLNPSLSLFSIPANTYNGLIINGYMYDEQDTHLDNIYYRNSNSFYDFEAVASKMSSRSHFSRYKEDEVVVNNPDTLATRSFVAKVIEGGYDLKYDNGVLQNIEINKLVSDSLELIPCRVTHFCNVNIHVINIYKLKRAVVRSSLRGFSGSVFLARRMPSHTNVTYQSKVNKLKFDKGTENDGTISGRFSTFGPPLDLPQRRYELEVNITFSAELKLDYVFDITDQIIPHIERINRDRLNNVPLMSDIDVNVEIEIDKNLDVGEGGMDLDVDDWEDNTVIVKPIQFK